MVANKQKSQNANNDQLIDELKALTSQLGRIPTRKEFRKHSSYATSCVESRFSGWTAFVQASGIKELFRHVSEEKKEIEDLIKVQALKKKYNQLAKQAALEDRLVEVATKLIPALDIPKDFKFAKVKGKSKDEIQMGSIWSDFHAGEYVDSAEMNELGGYDYETFVKRFQYLVEKIIVFKNEEIKRPVSKLNIFAVGDIVNGPLHDLIETAETGMTILWSVFGTAFVMAQGIIELLQHFEKIEIFCSPGNHGRQSKKPPTKRKVTNNFDTYCYLVLSLMLKKYVAQGKIKFNIPKSYFDIANIMGHKFLYTHGDTTRMVKNLPVLALERDFLQMHKMVSMNDKSFDYVVMGHYHEPLDADRMLKFLLNGSMIGPNEFALVYLHRATEPSQLLFGISKKRGLTWRWPVKLADATKYINTPKYKYNPNNLNLVEQLIEEEEFKKKFKK